MNTEMNVWNAFSKEREERKGARRESAHLSNGGNYSATPSPVTRGLGEWGCFKGRQGGTRSRGVGGCCYPESNWPETSCAVPADFHNDGISPLILSLSHTHTLSLSPWQMIAVLFCRSSLLSLYTANNCWAICSIEVLFFVYFQLPPSKPASNSLKDGN